MSPAPRDPELRAFGRGVSSDLPHVREAMARTVRGLLAHRADAVGHLSAALSHDPGCPAALLVKGHALKLLGRRDMAREALTLATRAEVALRERGGSPRELALAQSLGHWNRGEVPAAAAALETALESDPTDVLLAKLAHAIRFMAGDQAGLLAGMEAIAPAYTSGVPGAPYIWGCRAFALEEARRYDDAEALGRQAVAAAPDDVWGLHAVAHVLYEQGRHREGVAWLDDQEGLLAGVNNLAGHVFWHRALFHLELDEVEEANALLADQVAIYPPRDFRDAANTATLALQLAARGQDVEELWKVPLEAARARTGDHSLAFADLHYVLTLAWAGREGEAEAFVASMEQAAENGPTTHDREVLREVGLPLARAALKALRGEVAAAQAAIAAVGREARRMGGSHAQRRVLDWVLAAARARR